MMPNTLKYYFLIMYKIFLSEVNEGFALCHKILIFDNS
jgi:hypothetical protein